LVIVYVRPQVSTTSWCMSMQVKSVFGPKMFALGVVVKVPVPKHTAKATFQVTSGKAKYSAAVDALVWK
jgi:AP-2 complex subunit mu-1